MCTNRSVNRTNLIKLRTAFQEAVFKFLYRHAQKKPHEVYLRERPRRKYGREH